VRFSARIFRDGNAEANLAKISKRDPSRRSSPRQPMSATFILKKEMLEEMLYKQHKCILSYLYNLVRERCSALPTKDSEKIRDR